MLGAIAGDIIGSPFEFDMHREEAHSMNFPLVSESSRFTDDTVMTLAIADALMKTFTVKNMLYDGAEEEFEYQAIKSMRDLAKIYPDEGYGTRFAHWLVSSNPEPYGSYGNGSAMRVSPVAWAFNDIESVEKFAEISARVTHNHPEGIKGAQAAASGIFLARTGKTKPEIKSYIQGKYGYNLSRTLDEIRPNYHHVESCQETVPEAVIAFLEGDSFEGVARCAVSLSGDSDTLTAIACSIAEGFYGVPKEIDEMILPKLDDFLRDLLLKWESWRT